MSFSGITANPEKMEKDFEQYGCLVLDSFAWKYRTLFPDDFVEKVAECTTVKSKLVCICLSMQACGLKMYLILDEYDNFANNVLSSYGNSRYHALTHGDGFLRDFLKVVKDHTDKVIECMYITGVSPVTMDDLTNGFNIASNQSTNTVFNGMIGFTESEVRSICPRDADDAEIEKLLEDAKVQLNRYAECPKVQEGKGTTEVIKIALVFRGWDLEKFVRVTA